MNCILEFHFAAYPATMIILYVTRTFLKNIIINIIYYFGTKKTIFPRICSTTIIIQENFNQNF